MIHYLAYELGKSTYTKPYIVAVPYKGISYGKVRLLTSGDFIDAQESSSTISLLERFKEGSASSISCIIRA